MTKKSILMKLPIKMQTCRSSRSRRRKKRTCAGWSKLHQSSSKNKHNYDIKSLTRPSCPTSNRKNELKLSWNSSNNSKNKSLKRSRWRKRSDYKRKTRIDRSWKRKHVVWSVRKRRKSVWSVKDWKRNLKKLVLFMISKKRSDLKEKKKLFCWNNKKKRLYCTRSSSGWEIKGNKNLRSLKRNSKRLTKGNCLKIKCCKSNEIFNVSRRKRRKSNCWIKRKKTDERQKKLKSWRRRLLKTKHRMINSRRKRTARKKSNWGKNKSKSERKKRLLKRKRLKGRRRKLVRPKKKRSEKQERIPKLLRRSKESNPQALRLLLLENNNLFVRMSSQS